MLCMVDTLHKKDVLIIFDELEVQNTLNFISLVLVKTNFPKNFVADNKFPTCVTCHEQLCMWTIKLSKQTCT